MLLEPVWLKTIPVWSYLLNVLCIMSDCLLSTIHISKYANSNKLFVLNSSVKDLKVQKKSLEKKKISGFLITD